MKVMVIPIVFGALGTIPKGLLKGLKNLTNNEDHPNYSIIKIGQNTGKSPEDLGRLAVTQISVENHQLMLIEKLSKE